MPSVWTVLSVSTSDSELVVVVELEDCVVCGLNRFGNLSSIPFKLPNNEPVFKLLMLLILLAKNGFPDGFTLATFNWLKLG